MGIRASGKCLLSLVIFSEYHPGDVPKATLRFDVSFRFCFCGGQMHIIDFPSFLTLFASKL